MDETEFRTEADRALDSLFSRLTAASDRFGFEPDMTAGALTIEFEDPPAKFVVSPNTPVRQIWVSANVQSYKLDWNSATQEFQLAGQSLAHLVAQAISKHLSQPVAL